MGTGEAIWTFRYVATEVKMSIEVKLTDLAYGGNAVGRYEGRVLFVPGGIPGERVSVEIVEERRGHARAELLKILRPAPERIEPQYPELTDSGCQWQHIAYPAQLTWKAHIVRQLLELGILRSEEHTSELQSRPHLVCRLLLEKKKILMCQAIV